MTPDDRKEARTYAWGYFALHVDQRMKLFNFFLILSGLILGAFPAVRGMAPGAKASALLPLLLVLTAFIFGGSRREPDGWIKNGEDALHFLDEKWPVASLPDGTPHYSRLFARDDHLIDAVKKRWWARRLVPISYADSFRVAYLMIGLVGAALAAWAWLA
jgi:hypothetical protein